MKKQTEAMKLALEALGQCRYRSLLVDKIVDPAVTALREALAEQPAQQEPIRVPVTDNTYGYAKSLAEAIFKQHFASDEHYASGRIVWEVNDTVIGILTQIDNMVADMVRRPAQQQEPVATNKVYVTREQLAELVRADEREACAQVCDGVNRDGDWFAAAIRARGNT